MVGIRVQIVQWIDDHQPGWVECALFDDSGEEHRFREKAPVVSDADLHAGSPYPQPGIIGCRVLRCYEAEDGHIVVEVDTDEPWGIQSLGGRSQFNVASENVVEFPHFRK